MRAATGRIWGKPFLRTGGFPGHDRLVIYRGPLGRNAFRILAFVRTTAGGRGTKIDVVLRSSFVTTGFMTFWVGIVILINVVILIEAIFGGARLEDLWFWLPFLVIGFGLVAVGRLMSRGSDVALLGFIRETTEALDMAPALLSPR